MIKSMRSTTNNQIILYNIVAFIGLNSHIAFIMQEFLFSYKLFEAILGKFELTCNAFLKIPNSDSNYSIELKQV